MGWVLILPWYYVNKQDLEKRSEYSHYIEMYVHRPYNCKRELGNAHDLTTQSK